jgi:hypothetical protein
MIMSVNLQSIEATLLPDGSIRVLEPVHVSEPTQVMVTFAVEQKEPNQETQEAMKDSLNGLPEQPRFGNVADLMADLEA